MALVGFEPTISAGERPQTYVLDRAAIGTGKVAALLTRNYTELEDFISYKPVFALRNQVCVTVSDISKEAHYLHLQDCESLNLPINLRMKAVTLFENMGSNYPTTQRSNPADLLPQ